VFVEVLRGPLRQPSYSRGPHTRATSKRLLAFRSCIQMELSGKKHPGRKEVREAFTRAAKECSARVK